MSFPLDSFCHALAPYTGPGSKATIVDFSGHMGFPRVLLARNLVITSGGPWAQYPESLAFTYQLKNKRRTFGRRIVADATQLLVFPGHISINPDTLIWTHNTTTPGILESKSTRYPCFSPQYLHDAIALAGIAPIFQHIHEPK
jgi:hypothetical protein